MHLSCFRSVLLGNRLSAFHGGLNWWSQLIILKVRRGVSDETAAADLLLSSAACEDLGAVAPRQPATWAMLIVGFGLVGGAQRRRQQANARFA